MALASNSDSLSCNDSSLSSNYQPDNLVSVKDSKVSDATSLCGWESKSRSGVLIGLFGHNRVGKKPDYVRGW